MVSEEVFNELREVVAMQRQAICGMKAILGTLTQALRLKETGMPSALSFDDLACICSSVTS